MNIGTVSKDRRIVATHMSRLINNYFGCYDAALASINEQLGTSVCKATMTHRKNGEAGWPVEEVMVLESIAGAFPVTDMMEANREKALQNLDAETCPITQAGRIAKESGEAVEAIIRAARRPNAEDSTKAIVEIKEAIEALQGALSILEAREKPALRAMST